MVTVVLMVFPGWIVVAPRLSALSKSPARLKKRMRTSPPTGMTSQFTVPLTLTTVPMGPEAGLRAGPAV